MLTSIRWAPAALVLVVAVTGCENSYVSGGSTRDERPPAVGLDAYEEGSFEDEFGLPDTEMTALLSDPDRYVGRTVVVAARVDEQIDDQAFTLDPPIAQVEDPEGEFIAIGDLPDGYQGGERVWLAGHVNADFEPRRVERALELDWDDAAFVTFAGRPWMDIEGIRPPP